jgi:hypothetical protein
LGVEGLLEGGEVEVEMLREGEEGEVVGTHAVVRVPAAACGCEGQLLAKGKKLEAPFDLAREIWGLRRGARMLHSRLCEYESPFVLRA